MKNKRWRFRLLGLLLGVLVWGDSYGNQRVHFKHLTHVDGLSQSSVYSILEDNQGIMWFGTQDGLNRYDGYNFTIYHFDPRDLYSISGNYVTTIYQDKQGVLWAGTTNMGLNRYEPQSGRFYRYRQQPDLANGLNSNSITVLLQDSRGVLWIGTANGLHVFNPESGTFTVYKNLGPDTDSVTNNQVRALYEDAAGTLWIGTPTGLHYWENKKKRALPYGAMPGNSITALHGDYKGYLWVGTQNGLFRLQPTKGTFTHFLARPEVSTTLSNNMIRCIFEDKQGVLWVGTDDGLNLFDQATQQFTRYYYNPDDPTSLGFSTILSIYESQSGMIWIGTHGRGIDRADRAGTRFNTYRFDNTPTSGSSKNSISAIYVDKNNTLWVGCSQDRLERVERKDGKWQVTHFIHNPKDPTSIGEGVVNSILEDDDGALWIGTEKSGLHRMDKKRQVFTHFRCDPDDASTLSSDIIGALCKDDQGNIWVGTHGAGLNLLHRNTGTFTHYRHVKNNPHSLSHDMVLVLRKSLHGWLWVGTAGGGLCKFDTKSGRFTSYLSTHNPYLGLSNDFVLSLYEDADGILWIGTFGGGLNRYDPIKNTFSYFLEKDGLANNVIYGILEDEHGYLWLSSNKGITKFNPHTHVCKNYSVEDGLQSNEFNSWAYYKSFTGELFFGGINGITYFFPDQICDNPHIPPIVLSDFQLANESVRPGPHSVLTLPIALTKEITLSYKQNMFSFEFAALDYSIPQKNLYAYKMDGFDREWNYTTAQKRFATYTNLDPGEYVFRVKGSNNDGVWNQQGVALKIIITPPITRTWWFRLGVGLLLVGLGVVWYVRRTRELAQKMRLKTEMQTARDAQMSIMPQHDPVLPGFEVSGVCVPANEVGGDFFDYLWLDEAQKRFGIIIGDVSGKAMKAAMTAILSSGIIFSKASETQSISEILNGTNRPLCSKTDKRMFTALCIAVIDLTTQRLTFANAGLSHPMLRSLHGVTLLRDGNPQLPLGIRKDCVYRETEISLQKGDLLLLFTDGIPETQNNSGEFYEYKNLKHLVETLDLQSLSAAQIKQRIIDDTRRFAGTAPQHDDMTIVVIKVN